MSDNQSARGVTLRERSATSNIGTPEVGATPAKNHPGTPHHPSAGRGQFFQGAEGNPKAMPAAMAAKYIRHAARDARSMIMRKEYAAAVEAIADIEHMIGEIERELPKPE